MIYYLKSRISNFKLNFKYLIMIKNYQNKFKNLTYYQNEVNELIKNKPEWCSVPILKQISFSS